MKPYQVVISVATDGLRPEIEPNVIPPYFEKIIKECWNDDPDNRPEFIQLRETLEELVIPIPKSPIPVDKKDLSYQHKSMPDVLDRGETPSSKEMNTRKKLNVNK